MTDATFVGTLLASSAAATTARLCTHPLDTIRIRIQTWPGSVVPPFRELVPAPRFKHLYAGLPVALGWGIPALSIYLTAYEASKKWLNANILPKNRKPTLLDQVPVFLLSGVAAEVASGAVWTPLDVMKARLQRGNEKTTSGLRLLRQIWREEGYRGVWRGYWLSNAIYIPNVSLYWTFYETFKTMAIPGYDPSRPEQVKSVDGPIPLAARWTICSMGATGLAACVTNPIEVVQSRWQTSAGKSGTIKHIVTDLWRQGGIRSFGRGLGARIAFSIPSSGISMSMYETVKSWGVGKRELARG